MTDKRKSDIELFSDHGIYLPTNTISIDLHDDEEHVDHLTVQEAIKNIHVLDNLPGGQTINIFINSGGGCVISGMALYDAIYACKNRVRGYVYGQASSIASVILQACDERVISTHSSIMIHDGTVGHPETTAKSVDNWQEWGKKLDNRIVDIYLEKIREKQPKYRKQDLKRLLVHDTIYIGQEAIDFGLADRLVKRGE